MEDKPTSIMFELGLINGKLTELTSLVKRVESHELRLATLEQFRTQIHAAVAVVSAIVSALVTVCANFIHK